MSDDLEKKATELTAWVEKNGPHPSATIIMLEAAARELRQSLWNRGRSFHSCDATEQSKGLLLLFELERALACAVRSRPRVGDPFRTEAL